MEGIVKKLQKLLPDIRFVSGDNLYWSPEHQTVIFRANHRNKENVWGIFHEAGHAKLGHSSYASDIELLRLEVAAWDEAQRIAESIAESIDSEHIQDCLDTYRDWLHQRSTCPRCGVVTFQETITAYRCFNCNNTWSVTASRFCRPYRRTADASKNRLEITPQTVFRNSLKD